MARQQGRGHDGLGACQPDVVVGRESQRPLGRGARVGIGVVFDPADAGLVVDAGRQPNAVGVESDAEPVVLALGAVELPPGPERPELPRVAALVGQVDRQQQPMAAPDPPVGRCRDVLGPETRLSAILAEKGRDELGLPTEIRGGLAHCNHDYLLCR